MKKNTAKPVMLHCKNGAKTPVVRSGIAAFTVAYATPENAKILPKKTIEKYMKSGC